MRRLIVTLFGRFCVRSEEQLVNGLHARRAQELFSYLLLHRDRPYPRETLAGLLWEDAEPMQARKFLRQALWQIQTVLQNTTGAEANELLTLDADWVQLNSADNLTLDIAFFETACEACRGIAGSELAVTQRQDLEQAVRLYRADLLDGWYQDWCLFERERLQNWYLTALDKLVAYCEAHGDVECGLAHAERILRRDPAEEQTHYRVMRLHWMAGHRTQALRQYQRCEKILMKELDVQPLERTKTLYDQIRTNELSPLPVNLPIPQSHANTSPLDCEQLTGLMIYLQQLQAQLIALEGQLTRDVRAVEVALRNLK